MMRIRNAWLYASLFGLAVGSVRIARADTIELKSDASTLGAALVKGAPDDAQALLLDAGDASGLVFSPVVEDSLGTYTPVPSGAPDGTEVVNIPDDGLLSSIGENSGFFKVTFTLPSDVVSILLTGAANVDDLGRVFLNGHALTPSMFSGDPGVVSEYGDAPFSTDDLSYFLAGENVLLIADNNSGGGPSGAAFYANITYTTRPAGVPEPGVLATLFGCGAAGLIVVRRRR